MNIFDKAQELGEAYCNKYTGQKRKDRIGTLRNLLEMSYDGFIITMS